jgi:hypothetical protein
VEPITVTVWADAAVASVNTARAARMMERVFMDASVMETSVVGGCEPSSPPL